MSKIQVNHIKTALDKLFDSKIDMKDYDKKPESDKKKAFYSRALAAYSLHIITSASIDSAVNSVVDAFGDNGIDAIYHDESQNTLYLVQAKFIDKGTGEPESGELRKFKDGIIDLIEERTDRFNDKIQSKVQLVKDAFSNSQIKLNIIIAYTGKGFSRPNKNIIEDLTNELNESTEWAYVTDFNLKSAHSTLNNVLAGKPIDSEISLSSWGAIDEPYPTYYGQISAFDLAQLWKNYRKKLFVDNIRNFIGMSEINSGILKTIETEPENFIYLNNGVTALCSEVNPLPAKTVGKTTGLFDCKGITIINGAQTVGSLGIAIDKTPEQLKKCKLFIRLIPLNKCPDHFGNKITIASNTQNKIEKRDFVSLDPLQQNLRTELLLQNINYHYKRTDEVVPYDENNCTLEDATVALACHQVDTTLTVTAKREIGKLWDDITKPPYNLLFNDKLKVHVLWRAIKVYRAVAKYLNEIKAKEKDRKRAVCVFGNYFILHVVLQSIPKEMMSNPGSDFDAYVASKLQSVITQALEKTFEISEREYPTALMHQLFRNFSKCAVIKSKMILAKNKR